MIISPHTVSKHTEARHLGGAELHSFSCSLYVLLGVKSFMRLEVAT